MCWRKKGLTYIPPSINENKSNSQPVDEFESPYQFFKKYFTVYLCRNLWNAPIFTQCKKCNFTPTEKMKFFHL